MTDPTTATTALTITLLGTGTPLPDADRAGPATLLIGQRLLALQAVDALLRLLDVGLHLGALCLQVGAGLGIAALLIGLRLFDEDQRQVVGNLPGQDRVVTLDLQLNQLRITHRRRADLHAQALEAIQVLQAQATGGLFTHRVFGEQLGIGARHLLAVEQVAVAQAAGR